jgi:Spy/CpxP family protein refolding chaperone
MIRLFLLLAIVILACSPASRASEALDAELFPPEFLANQREALGLSDAQMQAIEELMRGAKTAFDENKRLLEEAARALQTVLKQDRPDTAQVDEKMRAVLDLEGDIKMLHLHTLLAVRGQLSTEQLAKARQLRDQRMAQAAAEAGQRERLDKRLEELRAAIRTRSEAGPIPPEVIERAREVQELIKAGKDADAEKKVDEIFSLLGGAKPKS